MALEDVLLCVPSNPCLNWDCPKHAGNWDLVEDMVGYTDMSHRCPYYQQTVEPLRLGVRDAYDLRIQ